MPEAISLSVVVPVKDEAGNVAPLASEIAAALKAERNYEIIFVDDGSNDATAAELLALKPALPLRVLVHERNLGQKPGAENRRPRGKRRAHRDAGRRRTERSRRHPQAACSPFRAEAANPAFAMVAGERVKRRDNCKSAWHRASPMACGAPCSATTRATPAAA